MNDVRCDRCNKLLARREGSKIIVKSGVTDATIYKADVVMLRCPRCSQIVSVEPVLTTVL